MLFPGLCPLTFPHTRPKFSGSRPKNLVETGVNRQSSFYQPGQAQGISLSARPRLQAP